MVDAHNSLVDIPPALATESEGSGLGGFERVARSVSMYHFRNRLDLGKNRRCGIDPDCAKGQGFTCVPRGHRSVSVDSLAVLTVTGKADHDFRLTLIHMLEITTTVAGVYEVACFTGFYLHLYIPALNLKIPTWNNSGAEKSTLNDGTCRGSLVLPSESVTCMAQLSYFPSTIVTKRMWWSPVDCISSWN